MLGKHDARNRCPVQGTEDHGRQELVIMDVGQHEIPHCLTDFHVSLANQLHFSPSNITHITHHFRLLALLMQYRHLHFISVAAFVVWLIQSTYCQYNWYHLLYSPVFPSLPLATTCHKLLFPSSLLSLDIHRLDQHFNSDVRDRPRLNEVRSLPSWSD